MSFVSRESTRMSTIDIELFGSSLEMHHAYCGYCVMDVIAVVYILHISCKCEDIIEFEFGVWSSGLRKKCCVFSKIMTDLEQSDKVFRNHFYGIIEKSNI